MASQAAQDDAQLPAYRLCQLAYADAAVRAALPRLLLAASDVPALITDTLKLLARTMRRISPGSSTPIKPDRTQPHPSLA